MSSKQLRQSQNAWSNKYFAIAVGAIMVIFIIVHWVNVVCIKLGPRKPGRVRRLLFRLPRTVLGLGIDRFLLYFVYWMINLTLILTNVDLHTLNYVAKRLGWISVANFVLLVFLALRNTPLAPLSGWSYEKLRPLHKTAGYTCITTSMLHATVYLSAWSEAGELGNMAEMQNFAGAIAGLAMVIIGLSTIGWLVRKSYEVFYMIHVVLFVLILIMIGMHRPKISTSTLAIIIFTASMWFSDRLLRLAKLCWYLPGNHAAVTAMSDGALRVKLNRSVHCAPGSHAFLWVPSIRLIETHPFTMVSTKPAEFLVRVQDGFTHKLYELAKKEPGKLLRCSVDAGYGQLPNFMDFERIVLVSGGSGASFTFAIALHVMKTCAASNSTKTIDFIWSIGYLESLGWFKTELDQLQRNPNVHVTIHVTRDDSMMNTSETAMQMADLEKTVNVDVEKAPIHGTDLATTSYLEIKKGRLNISAYLADCIDRCSDDDRVGIAACGPAEMLDTLRQTLGEEKYDSRPSITLHTEEFNW
ncbi:ferric reductase NAD binding domain-containing protein [Talaromyces proteolyticus]|uniref:Ferric reductase NAD binding domain-containing protein n=1 Tax=Talaromyces proteolyticus TaxID=1131652 RepID=A0AAD4PZW6_9EURO|nr:ferric reductase NAD binding domain-containing protein [Talaromyces proteolyticus]KAH8700219.1 ferric reductase NAD binding domain-containing protein [Talaromyces proteolyticus]